MSSTARSNVKYGVDDGSFVIDDYNHASPFSSFFPALAGVKGKPMWVFYSNRGQGISSFGVNNKDGSMMEFLPANKAYQATPFLGFRTFVRLDKKNEDWYEPFTNRETGAKQKMVIRPYEFEVIEENKKLGLEFRVLFFGVPNEPFPALARRLTIKNLSGSPKKLKVLDGAPRLVPLGMGDFLVKNMSRTIEAFAEVASPNPEAPFFRLKVEPDDKPDVNALKAGFFSFSFHEGKSTPVIVDPQVVFGPDSSFYKPMAEFGANGSQPQAGLRSNIMPSSFSYALVSLKGKEEKSISSYYGYAPDEEKAEKFYSQIQQAPTFFDEKRTQLSGIYSDLVKRFGFKTGNPTINGYADNTFMDNVLRGGFPLSLAQGGPIVHVFSRKHGDMERDYNQFQVSATYFSQGNGNFRDVNQNRRHDLLLNPDVQTLNLEFFFNLIQLDGYNPLVINPVTFAVSKDISTHKDLKGGEIFKEAANALRRKPAQPGAIYEFIVQWAKDPLSVPNIFNDIIRKSIPQQSIKHGEGFWVDHWIYNLDHLDQFLSVYPDRLAWLLFENNVFTFYDSDHFVRPRKEKYTLTKDGKFRQYHSVVVSQNKRDMINARKSEPNKVRGKHGEGDVVRVNFFVKALSLMAVKASSLDPYGAGIEMDADKPGWCDALNGLPGLFGSSTHELYELKKLAAFLWEKALPLCPKNTLEVPIEVANLLKEIAMTLPAAQKDFRPTWDKLATARENFREKTFFGLTGKNKVLKMTDLNFYLKKINEGLDTALEKTTDPETKLPTSYFTYSFPIAKLPPDWKTKMAKIPFEQKRVPLFLEGAVHAMKTLPEAKKKLIYKNMKKSVLRDSKLGMYRLNASLEKENPDLGRITVFSEGWLENGSIFLHMHYKYLLEVLRAGLTKEFFEEIKTGWIPFRNMENYGRPIFENSSFLASSAFPKKEFHGKGFVARLSGATAEFLSMVYYLALGPTLFKQTKDGISFTPTPSFPGAWFNAQQNDFGLKNTIELTLFGVPLTFVNAKRKDCFGGNGAKVTSFEWIQEGRYYNSDGPSLPEQPSQMLREGRLESLTIFLGK